MYQKLFSTLMVVLLITLLIGFGISKSHTEHVIAKAQLAIEGVQTYRIKGEVTNIQNGETTRSSIQMEFVSPYSLHTVTTYEGETAESIRIGQMEYYRITDSNKWEVRQWPESFPFPNLSAGMAETLGSLVTVVEMADEEINGVDCFHYKGNIDMKAIWEEQKTKLDPSQPDYEEWVKALEIYNRWQLTCEFWVGKEDYLLRQLEQHQWLVFIKDAEEDMEGDEQQDITATYRFFDFNQHIQIEPPIAESVQ